MKEMEVFRYLLLISYQAILGFEENSFYKKKIEACDFAHGSKNLLTLTVIV